jgi:hypothetical protein
MYNRIMLEHVRIHKRWILKKMIKVFQCFLVVLSFSLLFACGPEIRDHTIRSRTSLGPGWYHEGKTPEEMRRDYDECQSQARENDNNPLVKDECMRGKGYVLK